MYFYLVFPTVNGGANKMAKIRNIYGTMIKNFLLYETQTIILRTNRTRNVVLKQCMKNVGSFVSDICQKQVTWYSLEDSLD